MPDVSGYGLSINIVASLTFPLGFTLTQFASDVDPSDVEDIQIGDSEVGLNGDLITWKTPTRVRHAIALIPNTADDRNMNILFQANRISKGKLPVGDEISMIRSFPGQTPEVFDAGSCQSMSIKSVSANGKVKTKIYVFDFENYIG